jgi:hypothetical protein
MELTNDRTRLPRSARRVLTVQGAANGTGWAEEYWLSMSPDHREWVLWITWFDHDAGRVAISHAGSCARTGLDREAAALALVDGHWRKRRRLWDADAPCASGGEVLDTVQVEALTERIWPRRPQTA